MGKELKNIEYLNSKRERNEWQFFAKRGERRGGNAREEPEAKQRGRLTALDLPPGGVAGIKQEIGE